MFHLKYPQLNLTRMEGLHFVYNLPPVWEHASTRVVLSQYVDGLFESHKLEASECQRVYSPHWRLAGDNRGKLLYVLSDLQKVRTQAADLLTDLKPVGCSCS